MILAPSRKIIAPDYCPTCGKVRHPRRAPTFPARRNRWLPSRWRGGVDAMNAGNGIQVDSSGRIKVKSNGIVVAGASDPCCCAPPPTPPTPPTCNACTTPPSCVYITFAGFSNIPWAWAPFGTQYVGVNGSINGTYCVPYYSYGTFVESGTAYNYCHYRTTITQSNFWLGVPQPYTHKNPSPIVAPDGSGAGHNLLFDLQIFHPTPPDLGYAGLDAGLVVVLGGASASLGVMNVDDYRQLYTSSFSGANTETWKNGSLYTAATIDPVVMPISSGDPFTPACTNSVVYSTIVTDPRDSAMAYANYGQFASGGWTGSYYGWDTGAWSIYGGAVTVTPSLYAC